MKVAVYPGSFDPLTNGHLDILLKALKIFDKVIILVAINENKVGRFSTTERVEMIKDAVKDYDNVEVDSYNGLTVEYCKNKNATHMIRGIRNPSDYEYELNLASMNKSIDPNIETIFFVPSEEVNNISSSLVIEKYERGEDVSSLVPPSVIKHLHK